MRLVTAGVDEAGRGALAGPVIAAAVVLGRTSISGIKDSKKLSPRKRDELFHQILDKAADVGVGRAEVQEIEDLNIHNASLLAMSRAVEDLTYLPNLVLVDGKFTPKLRCAARAVVSGDNSEIAIAAASIVAKVSRDYLMLSLDALHPGYGFARHKGYPTAAHIEAIEKLGVMSHHRLTFAPIRNLLRNDDSDNS